MRATNLTGMALFLGLAFGLATVTQAQEPVCKGMEQADCEEAASCSWVAAYQRRDGIEVSAHCRTRPGSRKPAVESEDKKAADTEEQRDETEVSPDADAEASEDGDVDAEDTSASSQ